MEPLDIVNQGLQRLNFLRQDRLVGRDEEMRQMEQEIVQLLVPQIPCHEIPPYRPGHAITLGEVHEGIKEEDCGLTLLRGSDMDFLSRPPRKIEKITTVEWRTNHWYSGAFGKEKEAVELHIRFDNPDLLERNEVMERIINGNLEGFGIGDVYRFRYKLAPDSSTSGVDQTEEAKLKGAERKEVLRQVLAKLRNQPPLEEIYPDWVNAHREELAGQPGVFKVSN